MLHSCHERAPGKIVRFCCSLTGGSSNADSKEADPNRSIAETAESALAWVEDSDEASARCVRPPERS